MRISIARSNGTLELTNLSLEDLQKSGQFKVPVVVVAPHMDDEIYSCMSVLQEAIYNQDPIWLVYASHGEHQEKRYEMYGKLSMMLGYDLTIIRLDAFEDGKSNETPIVNLVTNLDKIVAVSKALFIPEKSNHQDHEYVYRACMSAIRYRDKLPKKFVCYAYNYVYNHEEIIPNVYQELYKGTFDIKYAFLGVLDRVDGILKDYVNSGKVIEAIARVNGSKIPAEFGESFRLIRKSSLF